MPSKGIYKQGGKYRFTRAVFGVIERYSLILPEGDFKEKIKTLIQSVKEGNDATLLASLLMLPALEWWGTLNEKNDSLEKTRKTAQRYALSSGLDGFAKQAMGELSDTKFKLEKLKEKLRERGYLKESSVDNPNADEDIKKLFDEMNTHMVVVRISIEGMIIHRKGIKIIDDCPMLRPSSLAGILPL